MKYFILAILLLLTGCTKTERQDNMINSTSNAPISEWKAPDGDWYIHKDGDWFGHFEGWFRYVIQIQSDTSVGKIFGKELYPIFVLESYKQSNNSSKIERLLHLTILGNKDDIGIVKIKFDDKKWLTFKTIKKHNIEIHFQENDINRIINELKQAKTFSMSYSYHTIHFNNKNFNRYYK